MPHAMPAKPLESLHYGKGRFVALKQAKLGSGWQIKTPNWKVLGGRKRSRFTKIPMLCADRPGAELTLKFSGTCIGVYVVAGPDAGVLEARVDKGKFRSVNLFHRFSSGLHYPRTVLLGADLPPGKHVLTLRVSENTKTRGHAARIMKFVAN